MFVETHFYEKNKNISLTASNEYELLFEAWFEVFIEFKKAKMVHVITSFELETFILRI